MFTVRHRYLHLQKLFGDLGGIDFDSPAERGCVHFARFDAGKGGFPLSGHFDIGNAFALYGMVHRQTFLGRDKVLLVTAHVVTGEQGFDNGRTGGGRADADVFQAVPQFGFLQLLAATLHSGKQAALGVQGTGLGLFLHVLRRLQGEGFTGLQRRKGGGFFFLVLLATDDTPSGRFDNCPFGDKVATRCGETDGGNVLYATGGEGFEQAGGNHIVHLAFVLRQFAG